VVISVIICSYNPRWDYLQRCLAALRAQTIPLDCWELLLIDNRSQIPLADRVDLSWHPDARVIREQVLGLTPARLRAIRESRGDLLVFVDDDNVLDPDFLEVASRTAEEYPFLASWSGQCHPEFEQPPPEWTRRYWGNIAIRQFDRDRWSNLPLLAATIPCGAGLCVRRNVALRYLHLHDSGERRFQADRAGQVLLSGGDNDLAACACDLGFGLGLIASLKLTHIIPPQRLTVEYMGRLVEGIYFSSTVLNAERGAQVTARGVLGRIIDFLRIMRLQPPHRQILRAAFRGRDRAVRQVLRGDYGSTTEPLDVVRS
jgi:glycosyltransferase involved in cell wall biosynthesis